MNPANRITKELSFITTTIVDWVDLFTRPVYKHISAQTDLQSVWFYYKDL